MPEAPEPTAGPRRWYQRIDWGLGIVGILSFGSAAYVFFKEGPTLWLQILMEDAWLFASILPKVALGCLIGAFVRLLISREMIERYVGRGSGLPGLAIAGLIGMLFPAGPFTIFPLAVVLMASGADRGAAVTFISAWLLIGINRAIIWEMPFFGTDFVLFRFLLSMPMPILLGLMARAPVFERLSPTPPRSDGPGGVA
ncbi:permease [Rhabdaerophilum sp. SD176]|uniref:permease n=1 Tax=Rhabdaerophilum sp. SD176 TaxID=2983548 RepID=UPI0024E037A3|nr:permease [Rhabdaerophilum sp. SD176]